MTGTTSIQVDITAPALSKATATSASTSSLRRDLINFVEMSALISVFVAINISW